MTTGEHIVRLLVRSTAALLLLTLLLWPADWALWRLRVATGGGMGQVVVSRFTVASLKGNKEDYYFEGSGPADCSRSLFPQAGSGACWWLTRHPQVTVKY